MNSHRQIESLFVYKGLTYALATLSMVMFSEQDCYVKKTFRFNYGNIENPEISQIFFGPHRENHHLKNI